ncbi:hypothetical protein HGP16_18550 [Rhizobium sp. P40RR-XXII]|uniref:DUF1127 domain-containing protein n=1 Tax=Rhizobium sp. P40RR-XXII TaxID=2726739 RepID=UPI001456FC3C|nr:DUF1127 domain-containing protein [Rhizobium sp. P40RR-XXII]NLS18562.1 hypothetical protein [Rhizobium sp. P40RR-XXII]
MSLIHMSTDILDELAIWERTYRPVGATIALVGAARKRISRLVAAIRYHADMRRLARVSDHILQDIGFERDWNGAVIPR